ncbi:MAG TPA: tetratricopeptide repeat protein [Opitutaceae bacterium]|jgi:tetratricopeptide (TPR) repeat protein
MTPRKERSIHTLLRSNLLLAAALAGAILAVYAAAVRAPFVFDDITAVTENPSIRSLGSALHPLHQATSVVGRPLVNLSLALNFAVSGTRVWSYHAFNILVHILAALALFALVLATLRDSRATAQYRGEAGLLAFSVAALWALHPLQTESVTYVVQRAESMAGLFYLLVLCFLARAPLSRRPNLWLGLSVGACFLGVCAKEVVATAPLMAILYDRAFIAGSFRGAWRARWRYYVFLGTSWIPLGILAGTAGWNRGGSAGFGSTSIWTYWQTQLEALCRYLQLSIWPSPLVFDYGPYQARASMGLVACGLVLLVLAGATAALLRGNRPAGFVGAWFFVALSPTSIVPVGTQTIADHRMYLALAAPIAAVVLGSYRLFGRRTFLGVLAAAIALAASSAARDRVYATPVSLWRDTVAKRPDNARARDNYGLALFDEGQTKAAVRQYEASLSIEPRDQGTRNNLGNAYAAMGRDADSERQYGAALAIQPDFAPALYDLANLLQHEGRTAAAIADYRRVVQLVPDNPAAQLDLGTLLSRDAGTLDEAIAHLTAAVRLEPTANAHLRLGEALASAGRPERAAPEYEAALALDGRLASASYDLGTLLASTGRVSEGINYLRESLRADPQSPRAHFGLGNALAEQGSTAEASAEFHEALRLDPSFAEAHMNLAMILCKSGRIPEGLENVDAAIRSRPAYAQAHFLRAMILLQLGRRDEVAPEYETLLRLRSPLADRLVRIVQGKG